MQRKYIEFLPISIRRGAAPGWAANAKKESGAARSPVTSLPAYRR
jgi:hypothetical protein